MQNPYRPVPSGPSPAEGFEGGPLRGDRRLTPPSPADGRGSRSAGPPRYATRLLRSLTIMTSVTQTKIVPDIAIPPGELLAEEIEARGMTQRQLALAMRRPPSVINAIVRGRKAITPRTAIEIEQVLGTPASVWVGLEAQYRLALARRDVA